MTRETSKQARFDSAFTKSEKAQMAEINAKFGISKLSVTYGQPVYGGVIVKDYQPHRGKR